jgi:hypothetical protein
VRRASRRRIEEEANLGKRGGWIGWIYRAGRQGSKLIPRKSPNTRERVDAEHNRRNCLGYFGEYSGSKTGLAIGKQSLNGAILALAKFCGPYVDIVLAVRTGGRFNCLSQFF